MIVIDPGHTGILPGFDPGAIGHGGTKEAEVALNVSKNIKELFAQNSICLPIVINGYQYASSGGTSAATEPTWPGSGTVTDGTVVWTKQGAVQAIVDDNETYDTEEKKVAAIDLINF